MPFTTDFKAFATGPNALVLTPASLATQPWLQSGFNGGIADAASLNTLWRQSTFVAAGITQWMANLLNRNIFDDGNLNNFISLFGSALISGSGGGVSSINSRTGAVVMILSDVTNALGFTPVKSFNGPGGTPRNGPVNITATDVDEALGYTPVNKAGDTMTGYLAGPEPAAAANYATKNYVDRALAGLTSGLVTGTGSVSGSAIEYDFPLPFGGMMKVGQWTTGSPNIGGNLASDGLQPNTTYQINFVTPFPTTCAGVILDPFGIMTFVPTTVLVGQPTNHGFGFWGVTNQIDTSTGLNTPISQSQMWGTAWIAVGF